MRLGLKLFHLMLNALRSLLGGLQLKLIGMASVQKHLGLGWGMGECLRKLTLTTLLDGIGNGQGNEISFQGSSCSG